MVCFLVLHMPCNFCFFRLFSLQGCSLLWFSPTVPPLQWFTYPKNQFVNLFIIFWFPFLKILSWICICNGILSQFEELRKELGVVILNFKLQFNVTLYMITLHFPDFAKSGNLFRASSPYLKRASSFQRTYTFWKKICSCFRIKSAHLKVVAETPVAIHFQNAS